MTDYELYMNLGDLTLTKLAGEIDDDTFDYYADAMVKEAAGSGLFDKALDLKDKAARRLWNLKTYGTTTPAAHERVNRWGHETAAPWAKEKARQGAEAGRKAVAAGKEGVSKAMSAGKEGFSKLKSALTPRERTAFEKYMRALSGKSGKGRMALAAAPIAAGVGLAGYGAKRLYDHATA